MLDFLCIGAQKAGTSWLHHQLEATPGVYFPKGKEVHYWDWVELGKRPDDPTWYLNAFSQDNDQMCGDMTPAYALLSLESIQKLHAMFPHAKVIYIMRNPIERAWSAFRMGATVMRLEPQEMSRQCMREILHSKSFTERGDHQKVLEKWTSVFAKKNLLVLNFDDFIKDKLSFLVKVFSFLGLDLVHLDTIDKSLLSRKVNQGVSMAMPDDVRADLISLYEPKIKDLGIYLNEDFSDWLK